MPAASGAVAAGAIADRMIGPKENQKLAIVMVKLNTPILAKIPYLIIIQYYRLTVPSVSRENVYFFT